MIRLRQVKILVEENSKDVILKKISSLLRIKEQDIISLQIMKQSLDARKKDSIYYVYEVDVETPKEKEILKRNLSKDIFLSTKEEYEFSVTGFKELKHRPIVVGSGPAGLFAAYLLALHHYYPIVLERGEKVEDRVETVNYFFETGKLNPESNVQFGEGGAGTFSDGKLNTLVKDTKLRGRKVFETFIECGAPDEIMYLQKPHIGTNMLRNVVRNLREKIIELGGEFRYQTCLTDLVIENNRLVSVQVNGRYEIECDCLVLAIGHSARDTFQMLYNRGLLMEAKPFALGVRISHPQKMIDVSQYGEKYSSILSPASYKLTYTTKEGRCVYSFCMCPGGYVVNSSSEEGFLSINGMSNHERDSENANSAIVVTVGPNDFGNHPLSGIEYQRKLEEKAYRIGNGKIPVQLWKDFNRGITSSQFMGVFPIFKGDYIFKDLNEILPKEICDSLKEAIPVFGRKIQGFDREDAILAGIESWTSSPVRIIRNDMGMSNIEGVFPCGEGAGYAGGITTAAIDGVKVAEEIASIYKNFK